MKLEKNRIQEDIEYLRKKLFEIHPDISFKMSSEDINSELDSLIKNYSNPKELVIDLRRFFAKIGDSHTRIRGFGKYLNKEEFPFECRYFKDGYYIIKTKEEHKEHIGKKILRIGGVGIDELEKRLSEYVTAENDAFLRKEIIWVFTWPDFLEKIGIDISNLDIHFEDGSKLLLNVEIVDWDSLYDPLQEITLPYTLEREEILKYRYLQEIRTFYIQYNLCERVKAKEMRYLVHLIKQARPEFVVVDLRDNIGGSSYQLGPVVSYLSKKHKDIRTVVFTGIKTYSAGVVNTLELTDIENSISFGSPTSGPPDKYGETESFHLKNLDIGLICSGTYFGQPDYEFGESFVPDIIEEQSIHNYLNGEDVVWERYLKYIKGRSS